MKWLVLMITFAAVSLKNVAMSAQPATCMYINIKTKAGAKT